MRKYETPNIEVVFRDETSIIRTSLEDVDTNLNVPDDSGSVGDLFGKN